MIGMFEKLEETVAFVRQRTDLQPTAGVILGSGLGQLVERMDDQVAIDYLDLPHFPAPTVAGHAGRMVIGRIGGVVVVAMQGRFHYYEGHDMRTVAYPTAFMKQFGVRTLIVSNSAGGISRDFTPGDLMLITDHINLFATNPLVGLNDERLGPRFPDMTEAYSPRLVGIADSAAGYAAMTVVPESASVLTVEFKMNLVAPADGEKLIARGKVVRPGKTLIITQAEVFAVKDGRESLCALMQQTIMVMHGKTEK